MTEKTRHTQSEIETMKNMQRIMHQKQVKNPLKYILTRKRHYQSAGFTAAGDVHLNPIHDLDPN